MIVQLAWRNIWRHKARSLVIVASISLGLLSGIFIMGLYQGMLNSRVKILIEKEVSHLQLHHPEFSEDYDAAFTIPHWNTLREKLQHIDGIKSFTARTKISGMLATTTGSAGVQIVGVNAETENKVSRLYQKLIEGNGFDSLKHNQILIGKKLADKVLLKPGNKLVLTFTDKENNIISAAFRVSGIYQTENGPLDEVITYVGAADLNLLMGMQDEGHEVAIILKSGELLPLIQDTLNNLLPDLKVENWKELSPETDLMIKTTDTYSIIFVIIILLALMFGIINTMLMAVLERTREIGMLVALGMNKVRLFMLVLWETVFLTGIGTPLGILLAWIIITHFNQAGIDISAFAGKAMTSFGFGTSMYPEFPWSRIPEVMLIVSLTALLSSLLPSYKAMKLVPVEAMRQ